MHDLAPTQLALIDLEIGFNAMVSAIKALKQKNSATHIVLFYKHRFIVVSACIKLSKDMLTLLDQWLPESAQSLICELDSDDDHNRVIESLPNRVVETEYSYRHNIDARIVSLSRFKLSMKEPVILVIDSIQSLKDWVVTFGQPETDLPGLSLFSD